MIVGTGIDVIEVERVEKAAAKEPFLRRIFTPAERAFFEEKGGNTQTLAGTFAAKEAVSKALGTGIAEGVNFLDIEIIRRPEGEPFVQLSGGAKERLKKIGGKRVHISISHIRTIAVAQAVIEDE
ncbi:MAG: holo-ACP synthase [Candidatus Pelethousia sp.]|nr:holo-ACP synthase [Candidatus Pelethousia sp.]